MLTVGGDCGVDVIPIGVARFRYGADLALAWFDAHPDLNTTHTSPSGAFHGMALAAALGIGDPQFAADPAIGTAVLVGARAIDPGEQMLIDAEQARVGPAADLAGAACVYLHLDLDVLDPAEFDGACYPEPGGLSVADVVAAIGDLPTIVGAGITECATTAPVALRRLLPIIEALGDCLTASEGR